MSALRSELRITTDDGVSLSIQRLCPQRRSARGAVVLQHGLGSNGLVFTLEGASFAEHLCELGYDCFVPDLRGAGRSQPFRAGDGLDAYLEHDIPAILRAVREHAGARDLHWVGHSMGGLLLWMYAIENPDLDLARVVTIGSAIDYRPGHSVYRDLQRLLPFVSFLPALPFGMITRALSPLSGRGPLFLPESMNFYRANVDRDVCRRMMAGGFTPIPLRLFHALKTTFSEQGFSRGDIVYLPQLSSLRMPTLVVGGSRDPQATPEAVFATFDGLTGVADKRLLMCGRSYGHDEEYGHFDLIVGKRAQREVWPEIVAFLQDQPARAETDAAGAPAASAALRA
jgi:pimeloyl-ACP methyl ester carboxylesterase